MVVIVVWLCVFFPPGIDVNVFWRVKNSKLSLTLEKSGNCEYHDGLCRRMYQNLFYFIFLKYETKTTKYIYVKKLCSIFY